MNIILGFLLVSLHCGFSLSATNVEIENKGYTGVVIAIHPDIMESDELIHAIKETWTNASRNLYVATKNLSYFKEITILVPKSWKGTRDPVTGNENYDQADVIIAPPDSSHGDQPYTEQYDGCGKMGVYSHFTPEFLLNQEAVQNYGPRGKVVVHEWAHYRWGVFDETSAENPSYSTYNGPEATRCPLSVWGEWIDSESTSQDECDYYHGYDGQTNTYQSNCVFFPYEKQADQVNTSMMCFHDMEEVTTFCHDDDGIDYYNIHNIEAPNEQNRLCNKKSTWTVIMESPDFRDGTPDSDIQITDTTPEFKVVQAQHQRFVLVLDTSGSMGGWKIVTLGQVSYQFITIYSPTGSYVGMVEFCSDAYRWSDLKLLDSDEAREDLASLIPGSAGGGTCIGCGMKEGIDVLEAFGKPAGGHLVVITDGHGTGVEDVYEEVLEKGIIVETVFIETPANEILKNLSDASGGKWYFTDDGTNLDEIFSEIAASDSTAKNSYQLQSASFELKNGEDFNSTVVVDKTVGLNTLFTFTWTVDPMPLIQIQTPSGCFYTNTPLSATVSICPGGSIHNVTDSYKTVKFRIPGIAEVGEWVYTATSTSSSQEMTSVVTSSAANNSVQPIVVKSGMSQTDVAAGEATVVYAKVTQGYIPILGATVVATVNRQDGTKVVMDLYDNGAGADIRANDGFYSRYFTEFTGPGRYSVEVEVGHKNSTAARSTRKMSGRSRANYRPGYIASDGSVVVNPNGAVPPQSTDSTAGGIESEDIGEFSRVVSSGGFSYTGSSTITVDSFPPGQILDAKLEQMDAQNSTEGVLVKFTAPGNDLDSGTADGYELRYTYGDPFSLSINFTDNAEIAQSDLIQGKLKKPQSAGSLETFIIRTPDLPTGNDTVRLSIAIRAFDGAGNVGLPSNTALTNFLVEPLAIPAAPTSAATYPATATEVITDTPKTPGPTIKSTTTTVAKTTEKACSICQVCDPNTNLYMILMVAMAISTAAFLTSTLILSAWLAKVNKQLKVKKNSHRLRGVENPYELPERNEYPMERVGFPRAKSPAY